MIRILCATLIGLAASHAAAMEPARIRLNTVGYLPDQPKAASVVDGQGRYEVVRVTDGAVIHMGDLSPAVLNADTQEQLAIADFSRVSSPGAYRLVVDDMDEEAEFTIAEDVYREPFCVVTRGMYLWRCGTAVEAEHRGRTFRHDACHLNDALLDFVGGEGKRRDCVGGWHDAGDYNKYVVNAGASVGLMLRAWEDFAPQIQQAPLDLPENGAALPDFLAEIKWELDWLLTMQADDGSVYHKVSTREFGGLVLPEAEDEPRYLVSWSSAATADFVAVMAMASRHFMAYDPAYADRGLEAARKSQAFLTAHPGNQRSNQRGFRTGGYETNDSDDRLWATAELWEATGDAALLDNLESQLDARPSATAVDSDWDWGNVKNLGLITYLTSKRPGRDPSIVERVRSSLLAAADHLADTAAKHGYARPMGAQYYWGCNGTVARHAVVLEAAYRLTGDNKYRTTQLDGLNHLFGRNYYGRSFVTGLGRQPPMHPHDRRSAGDDVAEPWPGYLVGGANPRATDWHDVQDSYRTNEIAINWNAALIYALAAQLPPVEKNK